MKRVEAIQAGQGKPWNVYWLERGLTALEQAVQPTAGRFCVGDFPTVADCCLVPQLYAARRFGADVSKFPTLLRIEQTCAALSAFQAAHADAQPDALPPEKR
jgi:maleylpyruvate isomerase